MPLKVICSSCQEILYEDVEVKPLGEIIKMYNGYCPTCKKKLDLNSENLKLNTV